MVKHKELSELEAKHELFRMGELSWLLRGKQIDIYSYLMGIVDDVGCCLVSRRFGKSFVLCVIAAEICIKDPTAIVKYACPKQKMVKTIIHPIMRLIFKDAPSDVKPEWSTQDMCYKFPNGAEIQIAGTDNGNAESLRGGYSNLVILDEAAFMDDLMYIVSSILLPTTDTTGGKLFLASTPNPKEPEHEFHTEYVFPMEAQGKIIKFTLYDSPMLDEKKIERIIKRYSGGVNHPSFRCEYLVEIPKKTELTVIPEFSESVHVVDDTHLPPMCDFYTSMDVGFRDLTAVLYAFYNFEEACLYIIDETIMNGPEMTTDVLAHAIMEKENDYYKGQVPFLRVMDNDLKLANDLNRLHSLYFMPTAKDNKQAAVNMLRMWFTQDRVKIHERCKHLIYHINRAQWKTKGGTMTNEFKHLPNSPDEKIKGGHADTLDSLIYLVRNINEAHNPYPQGFNDKKGFNIFNRGGSSPQTSVWDALIPKFKRK